MRLGAKTRRDDAREFRYSTAPRLERNLSVIYDVVIAGAGPVGLFLACELRLAGLSVLVLEQAEDPRSPLKRLPFGMRGLSVPTIEAFYRRGLLDDIAAPQRAKDDSGSGSVGRRALDATAAPPGRPFRRHPVRPRQHRPLEVAVSPAESGRHQHGGRDGAPRIRPGRSRKRDGRRDPARPRRRRLRPVGRRRDRSRRRRDFSRTLARRLRRRPQHGAQGWRLRIRRHRSRVHRLFGRSRDGRSGQAPPGPPLHADGHVHLRAARHDRDGRVRRRRFPSHPADHARARAGGVAPRLRHRRHRDGAAARHDLDRSRLSGDDLPQGAGAARRRRRAHPFAAGRPGAQPRARRRDEPRLEAGRDHPRRRAGRPARQLLRANGIRWARRSSTGRAPRSR